MLEQPLLCIVEGRKLSAWNVPVGPAGVVQLSMTRDANDALCVSSPSKNKFRWSAKAHVTFSTLGSVPDVDVSAGAAATEPEATNTNRNSTEMAQLEQS